MSQWTFVIAAYAVTFLAAAGIAAISWGAMRRAEAAADALTRRK